MKPLVMFLMMAVFIGKAASAADLNCKVTRSNSYSLNYQEDHVSIPFSFRNPTGQIGANGEMVVINGNLYSHLIPRGMDIWYSIGIVDQFSRQKRLALGIQDSMTRRWLDSQNSYGGNGYPLQPVTTSYSRGPNTLEATCEVIRGFGHSPGRDGFDFDN